MHFRRDIVQRRGASTSQRVIILAKMYSRAITSQSEYAFLDTLALINNVIIIPQEVDTPYGDDAAPRTHQKYIPCGCRKWLPLNTTRYKLNKPHRLQTELALK